MGIFSPNERKIQGWMGLVPKNLTLIKYFSVSGTVFKEKNHRLIPDFRSVIG